MTDRELLELAAKVAGHVGFTFINGEGAVYLPEPGKMQPYKRWNPLTDDGDARRLAVRLLINVDWCPDDVGRYVRAWRPGTEMVAAPVSVVEEFEAKGDPCVATRRAIVRAAAEIGKEQPK